MDLMWLGGGALANGVIARSIPQMLAPQYNVGLMGYGMNALVGGLGAWLAGRFNRRAGQGAWIGLIVALGQRIIAEKFGAGSAGASAGMSGDLDFDLGYYVSDPFPFAQDAVTFACRGRYMRPIPVGRQPDDLGAVLRELPTCSQICELVPA